MIQQTHVVQRVDPPHAPTSCQWKALDLLKEAWLAALSEGQDVWQFAVEIDQLRALGLNYTALRCLLCWDYIEHAQERTTARTTQRIFQPLNTLVLPRRTCFVLTAKGREVILEFGSEPAQGDSTSPGESIVGLRSVLGTPCWDRETCQLWWGRHLIKEFRRPAVNQELVLAALQEEGWPPQIDDPLPPTTDIDPKVRLHDTIKALNRHQLHQVLRFSGDGKGRAIRWNLLKRELTTLP
jgi:hypothetical protein